VTRKRLREQGYVGLASDDVPLARLLGAEVIRATGKPRAWAGDSTNAWWTTPVQAKLVANVKRVANLAGTTSPDYIQRAVRADALVAVSGGTPSPGPAASYNLSLMAVLGVPVVLGPIRFYPDGRIELWDGATWCPTDLDMLRALDAQVRLGGQETTLHRAARAVLDGFAAVKPT
jgi:hypothetical protein